MSVRHRLRVEDRRLARRQEIRQSTAFRSHFHAMCANIGVDPLVSNQSRWTQLLGLGDFYYELGVQIIEACLATRWAPALGRGLNALKSCACAGPISRSADRMYQCCGAIATPSARQIAGKVLPVS